MISHLARLNNQLLLNQLQRLFLLTTDSVTKLILSVTSTSWSQISQKVTSLRVLTMTKKSSATLLNSTRVFLKISTVALSSLSTYLMIAFQSTSQPKRTQALWKASSLSAESTKMWTMITHSLLLQTCQWAETSKSTVILTTSSHAMSTQRNT